MAAFSLGYFMGVSAGLHGTWILFTALGVQLGPILGDVTRYGFDMVFPAVFLVLIAGMWKGAPSSVTRS